MNEHASPPIPQFYDDIAAAHDEAWRLILRGVKDRRSAFHTVAVATLGLDGAPEVRTVVLRGADGAARSIRFHTDLRSPKIAEIDAQDRVSVHFYDPARKIQLRLRGRAAPQREGAVKDAAWAATRDFSRECYHVALAPGAMLDGSGAAPFADATGQPDLGYDVFCPVVVRAESLEWLYLAHQGHRRARFSYAADGALTDQNWLVP